MLVFLDITIIIIIFLLFVSITTGFMSLNERNANAIFQYRVGPALNATQGAALLPLADGVNLIFSSILWATQIEVLGFFFFIILFFICMTSQFITLSFGLLSIPEACSYTVIFLLVFGDLGTVFLEIIAGIYFYAASVYVLVGTISALILFIVSDLLTLIIVMIFGVIDSGANWTLVSLITGQLAIQNIFLLGFFFFFIFLWTNAIESGWGAFEWNEAESELITGIVTEASGVVFVIYAVAEGGSHLIHFTLICIMFFGGTFLSIKIISIFFFIICFCNAIMPSISISTGIYLIFFYLLTVLCYYLICYASTSLIFLCV